MNKQGLPYEKPLYTIGCVNIALMSLTITLTLSLLYPESVTSAFIYSFLSLIPLMAVKVVCERTEKKTIRLLTAVPLILLSLLVPDEVSSWSWIIMLTLFSFVFVFAPHIDGRVLMSKPHIWDLIPLLFMHAIAQITARTPMIISSILMILTFILCFMMEKNMRGVVLEIKSREGAVSREGILRENRRVLILFIVIYLILSVLIPAAFSLLSKESEETAQYYEFGDYEREDEEVKTEVKAKDIRLTKKTEAIDYSGAGSVLMYIFLFLLATAVVLGIYSIFYRLFSILNTEKRKRNTLSEDIKVTEETVVAEKKEKRMKTSDPSFFTPSGRLRRLYRKAVLSRTKEREKLSSMTTGEIERSLSLTDSVTALYDRTRYTETVPTKDEIRKMQEDLRK